MSYLWTKFGGLLLALGVLYSLYLQGNINKDNSSQHFESLITIIGLSGLALFIGLVAAFASTAMKKGKSILVDQGVFILEMLLTLAVAALVFIRLSASV